MSAAEDIIAGLRGTGVPDGVVAQATELPAVEHQAYVLAKAALACVEEANAAEAGRITALYPNIWSKQVSMKYPRGGGPGTDFQAAEAAMAAFADRTHLEQVRRLHREACDLLVAAAELILAPQFSASAWPEVGADFFRYRQGVLADDARERLLDLCLRCPLAEARASQGSLVPAL